MSKVATSQESLQKISIIIPTFNCASELRRCLESVKWANEIIVIDMGSVDDTVRIARKYGSKVYQRLPEGGNFDQNRKFGMRKAKGDWILKLDSDEILSPGLQKEIQNFLSKDDGTYNGFNLYNKIFMFGHRISHGFVKPGSHELRLVRKGKWHYDPYRFHQLITVDGKVAFMKHSYDHYNFDSIHEFFEKTNRYTDLDSKVVAVRYRFIRLRLIFAPIKTFFKLSCLQLGFLDGELGFVVCVLFALYNLVEKIKIWEQQSAPQPLGLTLIP